MKRTIAGAIVLSLALAGCNLQSGREPYTVRDTQILSFTSKDKSHNFQFFVGLPRNYTSRSDKYPVIYLLDADYSFPLAQIVLRHFTDRGQLKEAIIVGIAYPGASTDLNIYKRTRTIDYSPTYSPDGGYSAEDQKYSGGGPKFLKILSDEILPYVDAHFRTNPSSRMIVGHSFGALFATYAMLNRPELFQDYLIVSPSYWYDKKEIFTEAKAYTTTHKSLPAHVFYAVGSWENHPGGQTMVEDIKAMDQLLLSAHLEGYKSQLQVFDGDTHNSVFPPALTRGLRLLDDFAGEANGNALERK